jgi:hypothetical protein
MAAQISQFSKCIQRKMIKLFSEQNGGSARGYQETLRSVDSLDCGRGARGQSVYISGLRPNPTRHASAGGL